MKIVDKNESQMYEGRNAGDMFKERERRMQDMQRHIDQVMENEWHGQPIAIVYMIEDENGNPIGYGQCVTGVGGADSQVRILGALAKTQNDMLANIMRASNGDPVITKKVAKELARIKEEE